MTSELPWEDLSKRLRVWRVVKSTAYRYGLRGLLAANLLLSPYHAPYLVACVAVRRGRDRLDAVAASVTLERGEYCGRPHVRKTYTERIRNRCTL